MAKTTTKSYLIIGSGVFGASTAFHLSKAHPDASITLVDRDASYPCRLAASHDENKIVRADYGSLFYCDLALKARELWQNDPLYKPYYHQSGMVVMDESDLGRRIIKNYETLKAHHECEILGVEEMMTRYDGLFADADYNGAKEIFINPLSGWVEATLAVKNVIDAAIKNGVKYIEGVVDTLMFDGEGVCTGVKLKSGNLSTPKDGTILSADKVILSTGAGTSSLLADSAPNQKDLQVEDRITAAAVVTGFVQLTHEQMRRFKNAPVFIHSVGEVLGEVLPPTPGGVLKICVDVSFKNTSLHEKSGQMISAPPNQPNQGQHIVPQSLKDECFRVIKGICGSELPDVKFDWFRICWDAFTPTQDFIISVHPHCKNLYIATAGSFHGWKFLPIIGQYVVQLLDGTLEGEFVQRWAWDRPQTEGAHEAVRPDREIRDLI